MKRRLSLMLAIILAVGSVSACAGGGSTPGNSSGGQTNQQPAQTGETGHSGAEEPLKFSMSITTSGNPHVEQSPDINKDKWVLELEKRTNTDVQLTTIPLKDFDSKMSIMFASNNIPDVVQNVGGATDKSMAGSVQAGVFMPLDDLLKQHAPNIMKHVTQAAWDEVSYKGKIYGIPNWLSNPSRRATFIRTDLLKQTGLPVPKTPEEFLDVIRAFKKLGVENPYQLRMDFKYADLFFGPYDALGYQFMQQGDEIVPKFFDVDNMTKALTMYKTMYDEGLVPKDFATLNVTTYAENINGGKAGMWTSNAAGLLDFRSKIKAVDPKAEVEIIPSPVGPEGLSGYGLYSSVITSLYINKNVPEEKAIRIIKMLDWMLTDEAKMFFTFGIEGENYTIDNGKVNYKAPTTAEEEAEQGFRGMLGFVGDATINRMRMEQLEGGQDVLDALDNTLAREGVGGIIFIPDLESFQRYPDLASKRPDQAPKIIVDHMVKMIYGNEDIADWPKVIEEYRQKGGNEIIKEATERFNNKDGVVIQESRLR
ncbi:extracellular solute-binding protein [Paenibacillus sp. FSL R5-0810]|uniref:extracellular solute-binding protein n=1 Tax=Paenibacillus sp. FSL R5-0810 TaxID=2921659 RepID=UPI0030FBE58A